LHTVLSQQLNVRQTEELVRKLTGVKPRTLPLVEVDPHFQELEERLRVILGTRVTLRSGKKGGTITIHYYSDEELNELIEKLT
jgi:ParB family chromosome partitioning protein